MKNLSAARKIAPLQTVILSERRSRESKGFKRAGFRREAQMAPRGVFQAQEKFSWCMLIGGLERSDKN